MARKKNIEQLAQKMRQLQVQPSVEVGEVAIYNPIIDDRVYHVGASIKDLGKKWFAILEMKDQDPDDLISRL